MAAANPRDLTPADLQNLLSRTNLAGRRAFLEAYERQLFPRLGTSTAQTKWQSYRNITRVTLWGHEHFRNNVRWFRVLEALGLGPDYYCVQRTLHPHYADRFTTRLLLLLQFLPPHKIVLHPYYGLPLRGPFTNSVHLQLIGTEIFHRRIPQEELPPYCPVCHDCYCDHMMDELEEL